MRRAKTKQSGAQNQERPRFGNRDAEKRRWENQLIVNRQILKIQPQGTTGDVLGADQRPRDSVEGAECVRTGDSKIGSIKRNSSTVLRHGNELRLHQRTSCRVDIVDAPTL